MTTSTTPGEHPALTPEALAEMYAQAVREYPHECCGLVFGKRGQPLADQVRPCVNVQDQLHAEDPAQNPRDARTAYALGSRDLFLVGKSERTETPVKIIYHSHVNVGAYFSETDQRMATADGEPTFGGVEYVVMDVREDGVREAAQFAWDAAMKTYVEVRRYP
jgi:adenylyltransferase/sulfurtransferase